MVAKELLMQPIRLTFVRVRDLWINCRLHRMFSGLLLSTRSSVVRASEFLLNVGAVTSSPVFVSLCLMCLRVDCLFDETCI